jgi:hypothetical protein
MVRTPTNRTCTVLESAPRQVPSNMGTVASCDDAEIVVVDGTWPSSDAAPVAIWCRHDPGPGELVQVGAAVAVAEDLAVASHRHAGGGQRQIRFHHTTGWPCPRPGHPGASVRAGHGTARPPHCPLWTTASF